MDSAIYSGTLMHQRFVPSNHLFSYQMKMILLNLDELDELFAESKYWVKERLGMVSFRRQDYVPDEKETVKEAVLSTIEAETGKRPNGRVMMLTNLRYWGLQFNPATFFYCFDRESEALTHVLIEVHNTPWNERHRYVLPLKATGAKKAVFEKRFHVSPFNPMEMTYASGFVFSPENISTQIENYKDNSLHFKASLVLKKEKTDAEAMARFAFSSWRLPIKIIFAIYWQAFKLFLKRAPYYKYLKG